MDYDEWTPLGRGDPLKNDPTFDYSPPMVSKVKYWINPLFRTPDPPIIPSKELTTETSQYTATTTSIIASTLFKSSTNSKQSSPAEIKRFYIDFKDPSDMTYVQLMNSKYNNKLVRPQQHISYQNHYFNQNRQQPPPPLLMLVPPPPVEPSSYSSSKIENSTVLELSWDINKSHMPSFATLSNYLTPTTPIVDLNLITKTATPSPITMTTMTKFETKPQVSKTTSEKSILQNLLHKERHDGPTPFAPLTPNPIPLVTKQISRPVKPPTHLIIQGHSKVKKYGSSKLERSDIFLQDTNDINDVMKYEFPKDVREGKRLKADDFLPFDGVLKESLKDIISNQAEGSGFGAELTKILFPSYIRPSTTLVYESPRIFEYDDNFDKS